MWFNAEVFVDALLRIFFLLQVAVFAAVLGPGEHWNGKHS